MQSKIFRKAQPEHQGGMAGIGRHWPQIWPVRQLSPAGAIQDLQEGAAGAPGRDGRNRPTMATNMASASAVPCRCNPRSSGRRSRSTRAGWPESANNGHEYGQ
ncbi:hypothetical protein, partial [Bacillus subtilis]|uniref:hypothetical protein n=1 Tax=Bacillus subtilis TaxID=1423 RepID=UPI0034E1E483